MMIIGILIMLALALSFVLFFNYSQKKLLNEQMHSQQLAFQHQEELLHSTILTQEEERKRIARDLHDEIGSKLNVILLNLHRLAPSSKDQQEIAHEVHDLINDTISTTRRISHDLLPPTLEEFGLVEAIKELRDNLQRSGAVEMDFQLEKKTDIQDQLIELNLFRVLQELVNNSIRHGNANTISIELSLKENTIDLVYQDNGKGFDIEQLSQKKGLGMKNIESRLNMIQAEYNYVSSIGKGMQMNIQLTHNSNIAKMSTSII